MMILLGVIKILSAPRGKHLKQEASKLQKTEQRDVGRKIARVDPQVVEQLNITSGDALELTSLGKKTTVLSWPARSVIGERV